MHVLIFNSALIKSSLMVEARAYNGWFSDGDLIDSFTFPLSSPLNKFNSSNPIKIHGLHGVAQFTLSCGNLTTNPTPCNSVECTMSSTTKSNPYGNPTTDSCQCNSSVESPMPSTSTQTHQGK